MPCADESDISLDQKDISSKESDVERRRDREFVVRMGKLCSGRRKYRSVNNLKETRELMVIDLAVAVVVDAIPEGVDLAGVERGFEEVVEHLEPLGELEAGDGAGEVGVEEGERGEDGE